MVLSQASCRVKHLSRASPPAQTWLHRENVSQPAANAQGPTGNNARKAKRRAQIRPIRVFLRRKTAEASVSP